jgi:5-methylthioadenosine/S-adenosylhomocysteine deaminase
VTRPPILDGTLVEDGGRIVYVGPRDAAPPGDDVPLGDALLLPGLVNAHTHLELTAMRGLLEDLPFVAWIRELMRLKSSFDADRYLDAARAGIAEGVRAGVTTYADTCDSGVAARAMREAGVRGIMYQEVFGPAAELCEDSMRGLAAKLEQARRDASALVAVGVSPHAPYSVSDELFTRVARLAREASLPVAVHIAESEAESRLVVHADGPFADSHRARGITTTPRGRSPISLLERTGVLGARPLLIHCIRVDAADVAAIARARCGVAYCPASNAKLGHAIAPVADLLDAGVPVGLGSDSVASNNRMNILEEARLAVLMQRTRTSAGDTLTAQTALEMATIRGARALGLDDATGSLEPGKRADLAAFRMIPGVRPEADPVTTALFTLPASAAALVAVEGRVLHTSDVR